MTPVSQSASPSTSGTGAPNPPQASPSDRTPPEWALERWVKAVGKFTGAAGRGLDAAAKIPVLGLVVRLFSSVWFGIIILVLIGIYVGVGSGFPSIRMRLEMTDLQFFDAWPMQVLLVLLTLDLMVVTLRKIPLTLFKLGSWTVHIGILTLIAGAVWYFWHKEEGSVRIYLNKTTSYCYDVTERALYAYPVKSDGTFDTANPTILNVPELPIFYEHINERNSGLDMPVAGSLPGGVSVRVREFYPSAILQPFGTRAGRPEEEGVGPAVQFAFSAKVQGQVDSMGTQWFLANVPAQRVLAMNLPFAVEYLRRPTAERIKQLQTSFEGKAGGSAAITVKIPKLNIERTYPLNDEKPIAVEGSGYSISISSYDPNSEMLTKGYEKAFSPMLTLSVERKDERGEFKFLRACIFRFPELTQDLIMVPGKPRPERHPEGVDPDIQIIFHDATQTQGWVVESEDGKLSLITRTPDGKSTTQAFQDGAVDMPVKEIAGGSLHIQARARTDNAVIDMRPMIIPPEQRPTGLTAMSALEFSMVTLDIAYAGGSQSTIYVPFSRFAAIGNGNEGRQPTVVSTPAGKFGLLLATKRRELPMSLTLTDFKAIKYPGAQRFYQDYQSTLRAQDPGSTETRTLVTHLNNPAADHGLYLFQAEWDGDDNAKPEKRYSVIGVANRPGMPAMIAGAVLIILGVGFAFYGKPLLLKAKKESLARWAAQRESNPEPKP